MKKLLIIILFANLIYANEYIKENNEIYYKLPKFMLEKIAKEILKITTETIREFKDKNTKNQTIKIKINKDEINNQIIEKEAELIALKFIKKAYENNEIDKNKSYFIIIKTEIKHYE